jgi:hypothetical protein
VTTRGDNSVVHVKAEKAAADAEPLSKQKTEEVEDDSCFSILTADAVAGTDKLEIRARSCFKENQKVSIGAELSVVKIEGSESLGLVLPLQQMHKKGTLVSVEKEENKYLMYTDIGASALNNMKKKDKELEFMKNTNKRLQKQLAQIAEVSGNRAFAAIDPSASSAGGGKLALVDGEKPLPLKVNSLLEPMVPPPSSGQQQQQQQQQEQKRRQHATLEEMIQVAAMARDPSGPHPPPGAGASGPPPGYSGLGQEAAEPESPFSDASSNSLLQDADAILGRDADAFGDAYSLKEEVHPESSP